MTNLIFLHGLDSSSQGYKAQMLRRIFPHILTPDFRGSLEQRMAQLAPLLAPASAWVIVGSSFGGLMGALWTCQHPQQVQRLVLLSPALNRPAFAHNLPAPVAVPTIIYHGSHDTVVPLDPVKALATQVFRNLTFHTVDDDHRLTTTVQHLDWPALLQAEEPG